MQQLLDRAWAYLQSGGLVTIPLVAIGLGLWFAIGLRAMTLRRGVRGALEPALQRAIDARAIAANAVAREGVVAELLDQAATVVVPGGARGALEAARAELALLAQTLRLRMRGFRRAIGALTAAAPLLGLLGTVIGMVETFASLTDRVLTTESGGGVAGGISLALVSTQLGLVVAVPGLLAGRWLDRREERLALELDRVEHLVDLRLAGSGSVSEVCR